MPEEKFDDPNFPFKVITVRGRRVGEYRDRLDAAVVAERMGFGARVAIVNAHPRIGTRGVRAHLRRRTGTYYSPTELMTVDVDGNIIGHGLYLGDVPGFTTTALRGRPWHGDEFLLEDV